MLNLFQCVSVGRLEKKGERGKSRAELPDFWSWYPAQERYDQRVRVARQALQPKVFHYKKEGGQTMGMLRVMSRRGDERVAWDQQKVEAGDIEAASAVREAERIFQAERARGATAFRVESGKPVERIEQFDRTAEQIVMVPRVVGG